MLKKLLMLALVASLSAACNEDPTTPSSSGNGSLNGTNNNGTGGGTGSGAPAASATIDGNTIKFTELTAEVNAADMIISMSSGTHLIQLIIYDTKPGVYLVGNSSNHSAVYVFQSSIPYFTGYTAIETEVRLTEVDLTLKEITGTFAFTACESSNSNCKQIVNGVLNNIPITN